MDNSSSTPHPKPDLSLRSLAENPHEGTGSSGAWVFWLVGILLAGMTLWAVWMVLKSSPTMPADRPADPQALETLGFNLDNCLVNRAQIRGGGPTRDGIPALTSPSHVAGSDVREINEKQHGKFLVSGERVIGVTVNGESRAYPLAIMTWHEIVNDELGGEPIAVTYCPLCDAAIVFKRSFGDEVLEFGVSGLLYNSNLLLYDRQGKRATGNESLWSQLQMRAISGPAADRGEILVPLPASLTHWADWLEDHPDTTVIERPYKYDRNYDENPYKLQFLEGELMFDVAPKPAGDLPPLTRLVVVYHNGVWQPYFYDVPDREQPQFGVEFVQDGLRFSYVPVSPGMDPPAVSVFNADGSEPEVAYSYWEPWYATHPDGPAPRMLDIP